MWRGQRDPPPVQRRGGHRPLALERGLAHDEEERIGEGVHGGQHVSLEGLRPPVDAVGADDEVGRTRPYTTDAEVALHAALLARKELLILQGMSIHGATFGVNGRRILTTRGVEHILGDALIEKFAGRLRGVLLRPDDDGYDASRRVWNGMVDKRPALIARCACTSDVVDAVRFAREHDLLVAVRGGGHNYAGKSVSDGGLMIDVG